MSQLLDISDEELERDIQNTMNEIEAYHLLSTGFSILANLSNANELKKREYSWESIKYKEYEKESDSLLHQLLDLQRLRTDKKAN